MGGGSVGRKDNVVEHTMDRDKVWVHKCADSLYKWGDIVESVGPIMNLEKMR